MTPVEHPLPACIREGLKRVADPSRAAGAQAYMKSEMPFLGVAAAPLRKVCKAGWKAHPVENAADYHAVVADLWDRAGHREERYAALETARKYIRFSSMESLPLWRRMIEEGAWWDTGDVIAKWLIGRLLEQYPDRMKAELEGWIRDDHLWVRRSAVQAQLSFKDKTDAGLLFSFCERCLEEKTFWMRKAIGWALREYGKVNPEAVRDFVEKHRDRMAGLTMREASKYI